MYKRSTCCSPAKVSVIPFNTAYLLQETSLNNGPSNRIDNNLRSEMQNRVYEILYPEEYKESDGNI